jgi:Protein of unknown function (DUF3309)
MLEYGITQLEQIGLRWTGIPGGVHALRKHRHTIKVMGTILIIILILLLIGAVPSWPYSRGWGYWPGGVIGLLLIIVIIALLLGHL